MAAPDAPGTRDQFLGVWVVRHNLNDPASIDRVIRFAAAHGFKQMVVQVRGRGYAYYDSGIVPKAPNITKPDFDPLAYAVHEGHMAGLEVHAWVNVYMLWTAPTDPENSHHVLFTHQNWVDADFRGIPNTQADWAAYDTNLDRGVYLAPTNPAVNAYLFRVLQEIMDRYEIDGIHLDYIRYQGAQFGYNSAGRNLFHYRYGVDPLVIGDNSTNPEFPWTDPMYTLYTQVWNRYRCNQVTALVKQVHRYAQSKGIQLSAAVKPDPQQAVSLYFQNWARWVDEDLVDFVIPMNYISDPKVFEGNTEKIERLQAPEKVVMGIAVYNQSDSEAVAKLKGLQGESFRGICLFSYDTFSGHPDYIRHIKAYLDLR